MKINTFSNDDAFVAKLKHHFQSGKDLTTGVVARILGIAPRTVSKLFDSGRIKGSRIPDSNDRRIPIGNLLEFMEASYATRREELLEVLGLAAKVLLVGLEESDEVLVKEHCPGLQFESVVDINQAIELASGGAQKATVVNARTCRQDLDSLHRAASNGLGEAFGPLFAYGCESGEAAVLQETNLYKDVCSGTDTLTLNLIAARLGQLATSA